MHEAAAGEAFERAAHLRDAVRTIETLRDRRNKMEAPGMGDRDAFGVKMGSRRRRRRGLPDARRGRRVARHGRRSMLADAADREEDLLQSALQQFYAEHERRRRRFTSHGRSRRTTARPSKAGWPPPKAPGPGRVRLVVPQRGDKRGLLDLARAMRPWRISRTSLEGGGAAYEALDTLRVLLALPALPRRIDVLRHLDAAGPGNRRRRWWSPSKASHARVSIGSSGSGVRLKANGPAPKREHAGRNHQ